jgi:hypothetical protein
MVPDLFFYLQALLSYEENKMAAPGKLIVWGTLGDR